MIHPNVWTEAHGSVVLDALRLEARRRHVEHQPPLTLAAWQKDRERLLQRIGVEAGAIPIPCPLGIQEHGTIESAGFAIRKLTYQSRPGVRVTANLYVPDGKGPFPAVLGVHGHWSQGKIASRVQQRHHLLARDGFVVLAVDAFGSGERGTRPGQFEYHGAHIAASLLNAGESLLGAQVIDNRRGIDVLQSLPFVDADRIGVTGASGGGNQTMWVAALDPRVKAAVPVVSVGTFEAYVGRRNCMCEVLVNGLTFLEEWAVLGLVAPRALLILNSLQDAPSFSVSEMIRSFTAAREIFRLHGAEDRIAYQAIDLPHGYWPEMCRHMLGWFRRWLKGEGEGRPCAVQECQTPPEADGLCFPAGARPASVPSILEFSEPLSRRLAASHIEGDGPLSIEQKISGLKAALRIPAGPDLLAATAARETEEEGQRVRKLTIEAEAGMLLPVTVLSRAGAAAKGAVIMTHPAGKARLLAERGMKDALGAGLAAVLVDLRGTGETLWEPDPIQGQMFHDTLRAALWLGRTMIGDWVKDLLAVAAWLRAGQGEEAVDLLAYGETGIAALCAGAVSTAFRRITVRGAIGSYVPEGQYVSQSMAVHVPGILKWGDVSMMAALARADVRIEDPVGPGGEVYTLDRAEALEASIRRLSTRLGLASRATVARSST
jgi:dienelactone hydrolase